MSVKTLNIFDSENIGEFFNFATILSYFFQIRAQSL